MATLHPKVAELKRRSAPVNYTRAAVNKDGKLVDLNIAVEDRRVKCYLNVWGVADTYGTVFVKGCCSKSIQERGPKSDSKQKIAHLWQHRTDEPLGQYVVLKEDDYGLYAEIEYDEIPQAERALRQINSGTLNQFSIGFDYIYDKIEWDEATQLLIIREIDLMEASVVTFGSNDQTHVVRSPEQIAQDIDTLQDEAEDFIRTIPRRQQLELRRLFAEYKTLFSVKPGEALRAPLDDKEKPEMTTASIGGYKIDLKQLTKS